jgi:nucleoside-diphosphate-sugar epimerase
MHVLITGAAGRIGKEIVEELSSTHDLCLLDRRPVPRRPSIIADLARAGTANGWRRWARFKASPWADSFAGVDSVLHLAADHRSYAPWQRILSDNIQATWNVLEAAAQHKVRRVVFASSNWAVKALERSLAPACYLPDGPKVSSDALPRPLTPYGVSKALGELAGRMFVDEQRLDSFIAVRIGTYHLNPPKDEEERRRWIGAADLRSLLRRCIEVECGGFHIVYGVSAQPISPYDLSYTYRLLSWKPRQLL